MGKLTVIDPGEFFTFLEENAWYDGDEVVLPREDRIYLLGNLTGKQCRVKKPEVLCSAPGFDHIFTAEDGEIDAETPAVEQSPLDPNHTSTDDTHEENVTPLTSAQKKVIQEIHNNCGHPSREEFLRALRLSNARPPVMSYVRKSFRCPACDAKGQMPKPRPPASLPKTFRFNESMGVDLFDIDNPDGSKAWFCNMVCWGTLYQLCIPVPDKTADTAAKCVTEHWIRYFGPPKVLIADQGREFVGQMFKDMCTANAILLHVTDVRAPWQNGRTERHGDIFKKMFEKAKWLYTPTDAAGHRRLAAECNAAKNRLSNRSGYSPLQRVFGIGHRLPADLASDDLYAPDAIYDLAATDASFEESRRIREAALKAHAEVSIRGRVEDAVRARPRVQTPLRADDVVMVWKTQPPSKRGKWVGPGVCIGSHRGSLWVNMRGSLWKCSQLQCKLATSEESRGLEIQNMLLDDMKAEFQEFPGRRMFVDVEREWGSTR
jgi:transposase InsO family protein